jgi:hypothetical protein
MFETSFPAAELVRKRPHSSAKIRTHVLHHPSIRLTCDLLASSWGPTADRSSSSSGRAGGPAGCMDGAAAAGWSLDPEVPRPELPLRRRPPDRVPWRLEKKMKQLFGGNFFTKNYYPIKGVDIMITMYCDFCQFSAKNLAFFSKTKVVIKFLQKLAVVWAIFLNYIGPWRDSIS